MVESKHVLWICLGTLDPHGDPETNPRPPRGFQNQPPTPAGIPHINLSFFSYFFLSTRFVPRCVKLFSTTRSMHKFNIYDGQSRLIHSDVGGEKCIGLIDFSINKNDKFSISDINTSRRVIPSIFLESFEYTRVALLNKRSTTTPHAGRALKVDAAERSKITNCAGNLIQRTNAIIFRPYFWRARH